MGHHAGPVILDASFVVHALVNPLAPTMYRRLRDLQTGGELVVHVPSLWRYEVTNAMYRSLATGQIGIDDFERSLNTAFALPLVYHDEREMHARAAALALDLGQPAAYDAHYLTLMERLDLPMLTADRRLHAAALARFPGVELVAVE